MLVKELREEIESRLDVGLTLAEVHDELIAPAAGLSEDERAAMWLFAWSYSEQPHHARLAAASASS
jgi:hypothetical protein